MTAFLVRAENDFFCNFEIDWPGFCVWSKLTWFLHAGRKALGFSVSIEVDLVFVWVVEIGLISIWGIELDLISCEDRNWLSFFVGVEMTLFQYLDGNQPGLRRGIKINLNVEWRSKLASFQWWGRISLVFYVRDRNRIGFSVGIELDFFFLRGSKSPSALCAGRRLLGFNSWIEVTLFCSVGIELDFGFVRWPKIT